jgi:catechol 2,3-dioxygenase-like lactoylglutathione lyase family enzyme
MMTRPELGASLAYIELGSPDPQRLARFYETAFSAVVSPVGSSYVCRGPDRCVIVSPGEPKTLVSAGYKLKDKAALDALDARIRSHGVPVERTATIEFEDAVGFRDPSGNHLFFGLPRNTTPHVDGLSGRIQHVVVASTDAQAMVDFYSKIVGLIVSDRVLDTDGNLKTAFLRTDHEHHSFAVFQAGENRFDHHCYEADDWNAIRDWGDHFASFRIPVKWGPGRHGPGNNVFSYFAGPEELPIEYTAEVLQIDDSYTFRGPDQWKWSPGRLDHWGITPPHTQRWKRIQTLYGFAKDAWRL